MAKNFESTYFLKLETDPTKIINALKEIQQKMSTLSADNKIFDGVKKEFQNIDKLNAQFQSAIASGLKSPNDFTRLNELVADLSSSMSNAQSQLSDIARNSSGAFKFKNVAEAETQMRKLTKSIKDTEKEVESLQKAYSKNLASINLDQGRAKELSNVATSQEKVIQQLEEEYKLRQQLYQQAQEAAKNEKTGAIDQRWGEYKTAVTAKKGTYISNTGDYTSKEKAANFVNETAFNSLKQGVLTGQTLDQVLASIYQKLNSSGVQLSNQTTFAATIASRFQDLQATTSAFDTNINAARTSMEQIYTVGKDGQRIWSDSANNIINSFTIKNEDLQRLNTQRQSLYEIRQNIDKMGESNNLNQFSNQLGNAGREMKDFSEKTQQSILDTQRLATVQNDLAQGFNRVMSIAKNMLSVTNLWRQFRKVINQTFNDVKELDKAFGSIAMVTSKTISDLWGSYKQYAQMANELGQTTQSAIEASALFYQQGLDTNEALQLTRDTMKLATLAGQDFSKATEQMTAALRGFHMEMSEGEHVTDVYSELAANAAANVNGIAYAMSKTASIANSAGMSFENTAAFLTQMIETTQEAPKNKSI